MTEQPNQSVGCIGPMGLDVLVAAVARKGEGQISQEAGITVCPGGVSRNVAENLARLGVPVSLFTSRVSGDLGTYLAEETKAAGVAVVVRPDWEMELSSYCAWLLSDGEVESDAADYGAVESAFGAGFLDPLSDAVAQHTFLVSNSDISDKALDQIVHLSERHGSSLCLLPASVAGCNRLRRRIGHATVMVLSAREAETMMQRTIARTDEAMHCCESIVSEGVRGLAVITLGRTGAVYACPDGRATHLSCPDLGRDVISTVGGGDALAAGVLCSLLRGSSSEEAVRFGLAAAAIAVRTSRTCAKELSLESCQAIVSTSW